MRRIERTTQFRRDYRREAWGRHRGSIESDVVDVLTRLVADRPLETRHRDHALTGDWKGFRDCHIKPDQVLIYEYEEGLELLRLVRLGSHSELGL